MRAPRVGRTWGALVVIAASASSAHADDRAAADAGTDEAASDEAGFGDLGASDLPVATSHEADDAGFGDLDGDSVAETSSPRRARFDVRLRLDSGTYTERIPREGFAKLRLTAEPRVRHVTRRGARELQLLAGVHLEADAAYLDPRPDYDRATVDRYAFAVRPTDTLVRLSSTHASLTVGYQRVSLGVGEATLGVDQVMPRDQREPGLTPLEDGPLAFFATRLSVSHRALRLDVVASHEAVFGFVPPPLGTFSPIRAALLEDESLVALGIADTLLAADVAWVQRTDGFTRDAQGVLARIAVDVPRTTLGAVGGAVVDPIGVARLDASVDLTGTRIEVPIDHLRFGMVGLTATTVVERATFFGELVLDLDRPVNVLDGIMLRTERRNGLRGLLGVRIADGGGGVVTVEYAQGTRTPPFESAEAPLVPTYVPFLVGRYERAFLRDRLHVFAVGAATGEALRGGGFLRAEIGWDVRDGLRLAGGYAVYLPTDEPSILRGFDRHDRLLVSIRWDHGMDFGRPE